MTTTYSHNPLEEGGDDVFQTPRAKLNVSKPEF